MLLTSQIKELGAILQKLINLDKSWSITTKNIEMASMAMWMSLTSVKKNKGLGEKTETETVLSRTLTNKENKPF
jgi:hypothetical protein